MNKGFVLLFILGLILKLNSHRTYLTRYVTKRDMWCKLPTNKDFEDLYSFTEQRYKKLPAFIDSFATLNDDQEVAENCKQNTDDSVLFMPEICDNVLFEFLNDGYFWLQTFAKRVSFIEHSDKKPNDKKAYEDIDKLKEDQLESYYGLRSLLRFILIHSHYGIKISGNTNEALAAVQEFSSKGSLSAVSFRYPLISAFSHGGRIITLIKKSKNDIATESNNDTESKKGWFDRFTNLFKFSKDEDKKEKNNINDENFDAYTKFFEQWLGNNDTGKTTIFERPWSSHGFETEVKKDEQLIKETGGGSTAVANKKKEINISLFNPKTANDFKRSTFHYTFKVPFSGAGNRIFFQGEKGWLERYFGNKKANCWKMDNYNSGINSGHIYFRPYFEEATKNYLAFMTGFETSAPGEKAAVGGEHNFLNAFFHGEISISMGHKWKHISKLFQTQKKENELNNKNKKFHDEKFKYPIPNATGGKVVLIDEEYETETKKIYKIADDVLEKIQTYPEGRRKEEIKRRLWDFFLSEGHDANKKTLKALTICKNDYELTKENTENSSELGKGAQNGEIQPGGSAEKADTQNLSTPKVRILVCLYYYDCLSDDEQKYCTQFYEKVKAYHAAVFNAIEQTPEALDKSENPPLMDLYNKRLDYENLVKKERILGDSKENYDFYRITIFIYLSWKIKEDQIKKFFRTKLKENDNQDFLKYLESITKSNAPDLQNSNIKLKEIKIDMPGNDNSESFPGVFADFIDKIDKQLNADYLFMKEIVAEPKNTTADEYTKKLEDFLKKINSTKPSKLPPIKNSVLNSDVNQEHRPVNKPDIWIPMVIYIYNKFKDKDGNFSINYKDFIIEMINPENYKTEGDIEDNSAASDYKKRKRTRLAI